MTENETLTLLRVLIVDDEPFIRQGLKAIIDWEKEGCTIAGEASNGCSALAMLRETPFDIVVTDIKMPEMEGTDLIQQAKEEGLSPARFIILSGYYDFQYAKTAIQCGCMDYILKPIVKEELLSTIRKIVSDFQRERGRNAHQQEHEKAFLDRHLSAIIWGKYDSTNGQYVANKLRLDGTFAYVHMEVSLKDPRFIGLSEEKRREAQRNLYHYARLQLQPYSHYAVLDILKHTVSYDIGLIFCTFMAEEKGLSTDQWLGQLQKDLEERVGYPIETYKGGEVSNLTHLSHSFRETIVLRAMSAFKKPMHKGVLLYPEAGKCQKDEHFRKQLDDLIHAIEINDCLKIKANAIGLYRHLVGADIDAELVGKNSQFLMYRLLGLAYDQDAAINQEEIMQLIRETVFDSRQNQGGERQFQKFIEEYALFLTQLKQHTSKGTLELIEQEIEENYSENISLKSLGEQFFINSAYLGQVFKKQYGTSFKDYLNNLRIRKAAEMIMSTDKLVYEIALDVGYKNQEYFVTRFEEIYGMTPTRFRKRQRQEVNS